jgi:hypothetical protein
MIRPTEHGDGVKCRWGDEYLRTGKTGRYPSMNAKHADIGGDVRRPALTRPYCHRQRAQG